MEDKIVRAARAPEKQDLARQMRRQMTSASDALWQRLRRSQLRGLHFRRQQVIDGFVVGFYCREVRLVVEWTGKFTSGRRNRIRIGTGCLQRTIFRCCAAPTDKS
jgi:very-short-patch-repair endonuclease